jgi:endonuclease/exonuclease/phosphatase family metal-dependent hydrolase
VAPIAHTLRVLTLNIWGDHGDWQRRMDTAIAEAKALRLDIIGLQEVREVQGGLRQAELFARAIGGHYQFAAADTESPGGPIGNAVVSRLPLSNPASIPLPAPRGDHRVALAVDVETPRGKVAFISTHTSWELEASVVREQQVVALDAFARGRHLELPSVMVGDFNATPDADSIRFLTGRKSLTGQSTYWRDAFARVRPHSDGYTWSARNPQVARHVERNRRIDYVFVGPLAVDGRGAILDARVALDVPSPDGVFGSDHFAVYAEIALDPVEGPV